MRIHNRKYRAMISVFVAASCALKNKRLILALMLLFPFPANAECGRYWEVSTLARSNQANLNFTDNRGTVTSIPSAWFSQIHEIKKKIDRASSLYTKLFVSDCAGPNAYAQKASGQNVVTITLGMFNLARNDWDAYAALLGHENTHLVRGHGQQRQLRQAGLSILELLAGAALEAMTKQGTIARGIGSDIIQIGSKAVYTSYSRDEESEADRDGMIYAYRSGYDPSGAIRLHQKLNSAPDFLSDHPSSAERISSLRAEIALLTTSDQTVRTATNSNRSTSPPVQARRQSVASSSPSAKPSAVSSSSVAAPQRTIGMRTEGNGVVLKVKARYGYYIATQSSFDAPIKGTTAIVTIGDQKISGTVERVIFSTSEHVNR
jgi:Zn-dependent protease with chaperone function